MKIIYINQFEEDDIEKIYQFLKKYVETIDLLINDKSDKVHQIGT